MKEIITKSNIETRKQGARLGKLIAKKTLKNKALVLALQGDLGSGKTTFIQGLAYGFGVREKVLSPTFLILKQFSLSLKNYKNFYHLDAWRLKNPEEILELGLKDLIKNPENIIIIEWADKLKNFLPRDIFKIKFTNLGVNKRKLVFAGNI